MNDFREMASAARRRREKEIKGQIAFVSDLLRRLKEDFLASTEKQGADRWRNNYLTIDRHTQFENDVKRIRRELLALDRMFRG